jgi:hypothetical protein
VVERQRAELGARHTHLNHRHPHVRPQPSPATSPPHPTPPAHKTHSLPARGSPYRHRPASRRRESRGPSPHRRTRSSECSASHTSTALSLGMDSSKPSSPVYLQAGGTGSSTGSGTCVSKCACLAVGMQEAFLDAQLTVSAHHAAHIPTNRLTYPPTHRTLQHRRNTHPVRVRKQGTPLMSSLRKLEK